MRPKLSLITMLVAWLLATGSHWDLVQTFAWGRMIATYSQSMSLSEAVKLTFTPDNLCGMCESVSEAKQRQDAAVPADAKAPGKILLVYQAAPSFVVPLPVSPEWTRNDWRPAEREGQPPPVPPPQGLV